MRHHRLHRPPSRSTDPARQPAATRVSGLRLGRDRDHRRRRRCRHRQEHQQGRRPRAPGRGRRDPFGHRRHRPHALGDPRASVARECASAPGLHRTHSRHPQRHRRELSRAARRADVAGPRVPQRDRHRSGAAPHRGRVPRRPRERRAQRAQPHAGCVRTGGHLRRPAGPCGRCTDERAARRRARTRRGVCQQRHHRTDPVHEADRAARRRRDRHRDS